MLRFIKSPDIEIAFREKEKWFNPDLLKGLAFAVLFHLLLGLCFRISAPPNLEKSTPLIPIAVEIDLFLPSHPSPQPVVYTPIEKPEPPELLDLPPSSFSKPATGLSRYLCQDPDFSQIEKIPYLSNLEKPEFDFEPVDTQRDFFSDLEEE